MLTDGVLIDGRAGPTRHGCRKERADRQACWEAGRWPTGVLINRHGAERHGVWLESRFTDVLTQGKKH
jgi:hypothetical protein